MDDEQKIFSSPQAAVATLMGGPMAAGFVLFHNLRLVGRYRLGVVSLVLGVVSGVLFTGTIIFLAVQNFFLLLTLAVLIVIGFSFLVSFLTDDVLKKGNRSVAEKTWASTLTISLICSILQVVGVLIIVVLLMWYMAPFRDF